MPNFQCSKGHNYFSPENFTFCPQCVAEALNSPRPEPQKMGKWMRSAGLLLIWPFVVFAEGVDAGDTFSGLCGLFGSTGFVLGFILPILVYLGGFASPIVFAVIAAVYLVGGILVHMELYSGWRTNILRLPIHQ